MLHLSQKALYWLRENKHLEKSSARLKAIWREIEANIKEKKLKVGSGDMV